MARMLEEQVAVVTGASRGIGRAIAVALAGEGARVVVNFVSNKAAAEEVASLIREAGGEALTVQGDVSDRTSHARILGEALRGFGRLDILVNNAGYTDRSGLRHDMGSFKRMRSIVELDLLATINGCRLAGRQMIEQKTGGSIINVSSILGRVGSEFRAASYHAAKGGVDALTRVLALEYAREGIRVNAIAPSYFDGTELMDQVFEATPATRDHAISRTPMGRLGQPEDLEGAVVYLASDAARFVTGHILYVDGGWTAGGGYHQLPPMWESSPGHQKPG